MVGEEVVGGEGGKWGGEKRVVVEREVRKDDGGRREKGVGKDKEEGGEVK